MEGRRLVPTGLRPTTPLHSRKAANPVAMLIACHLILILITPDFPQKLKHWTLISCKSDQANFNRCSLRKIRVIGDDRSVDIIPHALIVRKQFRFAEIGTTFDCRSAPKFLYLEDGRFFRRPVTRRCVTTVASRTWEKTAKHVPQSLSPVQSHSWGKSGLPLEDRSFDCNRFYGIFIVPLICLRSYRQTFPLRGWTKTRGSAFSIFRSRLLAI